MLKQLLVFIAALSLTTVEGLGLKKEEYSFVLSITNMKNSNPLCGATLITPTCALTAAHCVMKQKLEELIVERDNKQIERQIERIIIPTDYELTQYLNELDFAIMVLKEPISYDQAQTVVIDFKPIKADDPINIVGWSHKRNVLESFKTKVSTQEKCLEQLPLSTENLFCVPLDTGLGSSGRSALNEKGQQVGIVSYSGGTNENDKHTYFIRFSNPKTIVFFNETILRNCNGANNLP